MTPSYDVFISYNHDDASQVVKLAQELTARQVAVWLDRLRLPLGQDWQPHAEQALRVCPVTIVCIGRALGNWQEREIRVALELQMQNKERLVIPVLLEAASPEIIPQFLKSHTWVDLRRGLSQTELDKLADRLPRRAQPAPPAPKPVETEAARRTREGVEKLAHFLAQGKHATFFIGSSTDDTPASTGAPPSYLARELLREAQLIDQNYGELLPSLDVAGLYYAVRADGNWNGGWVLEDRVINLIAQCGRAATPTHEALAKLIRLLQFNPRQRRVLNPDPQLIVTTNLDLELERALLRAGVAFTRVVQHQSTTQITINEYEPVSLGVPEALVSIGLGDQVQRAQLNQPDELDCLIEGFGKRTIELTASAGAGLNILTTALTAQSQRSQPILYKLLGSQDVQYSCAISAGQHFEFAQNSLRNNCIPREITKIIGNTPAIFIGYGFLDPDLRLMYHLLLQEQFAVKTPFTSMRYALRLPPEPQAEDDYRRIEARIWDGIKRVVASLGVMMLEERSDTFLERLTDAIKAKL